MIRKFLATFAFFSLLLSAAALAFASIALSLMGNPYEGLASLFASVAVTSVLVVVYGP